VFVFDAILRKFLKLQVQSVEMTTAGESGAIRRADFPILLYPPGTGRQLGTIQSLIGLDMVQSLL